MNIYLMRTDYFMLLPSEYFISLLIVSESKVFISNFITETCHHLYVV